MIKLSLSRINEKSPYVIQEVKGGYTFTTAFGIRYNIRFISEDAIGECETYQFIISRLDDIKTAHDPNISAVIFLILDEFFSENDDVLLYYCDASDHREEYRNRLFIRWFEKAASPNRFAIRTSRAIVEGQGIYIAIIVEKRNPKIQSILEEFDNTVSLLTDKPTQS